MKLKVLIKDKSHFAPYIYVYGVNRRFVMTKRIIAVCKCLKCNAEVNIFMSLEKAIKHGGPLCISCRKDDEKRKNKEYNDKIRNSPDGQSLIKIGCRICGNGCIIKKYKEKIHKRKGGPVCKDCCKKISSETMKNTQASFTKDQRIIYSKMARDAVSSEMRSSAVSKQWDNFRKDSEKFKDICKRKSERMVKVWENYDDETKNHIIDAFCKSYGKSRSTSSDLLKNKMIESKVYDGFVSEEVFHGFVPDEINHDLKIIVEMYGDLYHCNPKRYKNPDQYITAIQRTVKEQWQRDRRRLACFYKHGYSVVVVWDGDFRKYPEREIERIRNEIDKKRDFRRTV